MPKSKRNKIVHLTQVRKKGKDHKEDLIKQVEQHVAKFKRVFLFDLEATKSDRIMALRLKLKQVGPIFAGRNSLVTVALRAAAKRHKDPEGLLAELEQEIKGHRGLLFADIEEPKLMEILEREQPEFCKKMLGSFRLPITGQ